MFSEFFWVTEFSSDPGKEQNQENVTDNGENSDRHRHFLLEEGLIADPKFDEPFSHLLVANTFR